jgi:hypothetical protein
VDDSNPHTLWEDFFAPRSLRLDTHSAATDVYGAGQRLYHREIRESIVPSAPRPHFPEIRA